MLTLIGLKQIKARLIKMGRKGDPAYNVIIQTAVDDINTLIKDRFRPE